MPTPSLPATPGVTGALAELPRTAAREALDALGGAVVDRVG